MLVDEAEYSRRLSLVSEAKDLGILREASMDALLLWGITGAYFIAPLSADPQVLRTPHDTVALPPMDVSSTDIRARVANGQSIAELVPAPVARYIARHHLYQDPTGSAPAQELNGHS